MTTPASSDTLFCINHPQTPTGLRCNKCGNPICAKCAQRTPVGYRCKNCVTQQQQIFETLMWYDYITASLAAAIISFIGGVIVPNFGFFAILLSPVVGGIVAEVIRVVVQRRRGRYLKWAATAAFIAGGLPLLVLPLLVAVISLFVQDLSGLGFLFNVNFLWLLVYLGVGASTLFARLRGISL